MPLVSFTDFLHYVQFAPAIVSVGLLCYGAITGICGHIDDAIAYKEMNK